MCSSKWICYLRYILVLAVFLGMSVFAQSNEPVREKFDPAKDPAKDLQEVVKTAKEQNKRIILDVGGEWCKWCHWLDEFIEKNAEVKEALHASFVILKVNYSKENKNEDFLSKYPKVEGYPHFFVLNTDGSFLHSQNTAELEEGNGYSKEKFLRFVAKYKP